MFIGVPQHYRFDCAEQRSTGPASIPNGGMLLAKFF
jgi:hypothetical protein